MNKLSRVIALSIFGLSGSVFAADDDAGRNRGIANLDTDGDGSINFEEFSQRGAEGFARMDSDDNGVLTLDEVLNARPNFAPRGARNPNRPEREPSEEQIARMEERKAEMTAQATERFHAMDANGDEMVTLDEQLEANFLALDTDNNGLLSAEEMRPERGGRRGPGGQRGGRRPQA